MLKLVKNSLNFGNDFLLSVKTCPSSSSRIIFLKYVINSLYIILETATLPIPGRALTVINISLLSFFVFPHQKPRGLRLRSLRSLVPGASNAAAIFGDLLLKGDFFIGVSCFCKLASNMRFNPPESLT